MDENLFKIVMALIPLISAIITYIFHNYVKVSIDAKKLRQYEKWTCLAVQAAEMLFSGNSMGNEKKSYAVNFLCKKINKNKTVLTEQQIEILIESAVQQLNSTKHLKNL